MKVTVFPVFLRHSEMSSDGNPEVTYTFFPGKSTLNDSMPII